MASSAGQHFLYAGELDRSMRVGQRVLDEDPAHGTAVVLATVEVASALWATDAAKATAVVDDGLSRVTGLGGPEWGTRSPPDHEGLGCVLRR